MTNNFQQAAFAEDERDNQPPIVHELQPNNEEVLIKGLRIPPHTREILKRMNERHAFVGYGGKTRYLHAIDNPGPHELPYQFLDLQTFKGFYESDSYVTLLERKLRRNDQITWETVTWPLVRAFNNWPERRRYARVGFFPSANCPTDTFNLWEGWRLGSKPGSWKRLLRHIYEVVCRRDRDKFKWLIDWMTHTVQTTGDTSKRSPVSPVIFGEKGAGKSLCLEQFAMLFGNHGMTVARKDQLTGKFNRHLMLSLFVVAEEAVYAHDKAGEGPLKDMLTRKTLTIEPKNVDAFETPNYCRFAFVSNETLAIPMTHDERRYQPFEISSERIGDGEWFDAIVEEMDNGGREAMLYDLQRRTYNAKLIRSTLADSVDLNAMRAEVLDAPIRFAAEWIANGCITLTALNRDLPPSAIKCELPPQIFITTEEDARDHLILSEHENQISSADLKRVYDLWCQENLDQYERRRAVRSKEKLVKEMRKRFKFVRSGRTTNRRHITLPPATDCLDAIKDDPVLCAYLERLGTD